MKKLKFLILLVSIIISQNSLKSQDKIKINADYLKFDQKTSNSTKNEIINSIQLLIDAYNEAANFIEENGNEISTKKMDEFANLFSESAIIFDDISYETRNITVYKYINLVYENIDKRGVIFDIEGVYLGAIIINASGDYIAKVDVEKNVYSSVNKKGKCIYKPKGNFFDLVFQILLPKNSIDKPKILKIKGVGKKTKAKAKKFLKSGVKVGYGSLKVEPAGSFGSDFSNIKPSVITFGLNIQGYYELTNKKNLFLSGGLSFETISITTDLSNNINTTESSIDATLPIYPNGSKIILEDMPSNLSIETLTGDEKLKSGYFISAMLGIAYQFKLNYKTKLLVSGYLSSSFVTGFKNSARELEYSGYNFPKNSAFFPEINELEENGILQEYKRGNKWEVHDLTVTNNISFGVILSPTILYEMNKKWGMQFGIDTYLGLSPLIASNPVEISIFNDNNNNKNSILENYFKKNSFNNISLNAGIYYLLNK